MRRKLIGRKEFSGTVTVTDPCYEKGAWCTLDANVRKGLYDCYVWRDYDKFEINGEEFDDVNVGVIGIYLDGIIPSQKSMKLLGSIGVDAGLAGFFMNKPDYTDDEWDDFCDSIRNGDAWIKSEGFFSSSGYGDGCYNVYGIIDDGEAVALEIRFL